ncbi:glutamate receptor 1 isoform X2 [Eurytemora carolleeae]|uniref:glutamate receptor 1 isoform X2 n=1 Tax=Eurytemora carolleeae TaxID=1294199 RepID=UPI000C75C2DD|nr:glutamate receptor 1 isoform X2 [Eurytemora carolleeae]|eukprot:XP_023343165.1 glutamate receptor 1-like isoform X2 [Eurytemora affinis]
MRSLNLLMFLSVLVSSNLAKFNSSQVLKFIDNLVSQQPALLKPVMNLVLCDESDELIAGALDMLYTTLPHLNIKHLGNLSSMKLDDSTIFFCQIPIQEKINVNEAFAIFDTSQEWFVPRFIMEGQGNKKFLVKNNAELYEIKTFKSVSDIVAFQLPITPPTEDNRIDLHGITLTAGYPPSSALVKIKDDKLEGGIGATFDTMSKIMNFTYKPVPSIDGFFGSKVPGGVKYEGKTSLYNGLVGMLERGEVDVAVADLFVTLDRNQVADFGGSILLQSTFCVMAKPGTDLELMAYFKPLKPIIWMCVLCSAAGLTIFLFILSCISYKKAQEGVSDILSFSMRTLGAVETFLLPELRFKKVWRICMLTYLVLGFFVVETYKAELTSYLTSKTAKLPIQRMEDILDTDMKLSLPSGSSFVSKLQFSDQAVFQRLWSEKVADQEYGLVNWSEGDRDNILKALRNNYLVLGYGDEAEKFMAEYPCEVARIAVDASLPSQTGVYLRKNSPFTALFKKQLQILKEAGVVDTIIKKSKRGTLESATCNNSNLILGFQSTVFLFVVIGVGILFSTFIFILETIISTLQPYIT